jgi:beta-1,4-mannosyl-glycoprotein beta-1,4-N-acetylglucosaminyltransferase
MKVYDCFLFNTELEILALRLDFLWDQVDHFVIVESGRTLSNLPKPLHYHENKKLFEKYQSKIISLVTPSNDMPAWDYEFYQRNWIKEGLKQCDDDDLVFISDVDEIINIQHVLPLIKPGVPTLIGISMYYYFINLRVDVPWVYNIAVPWGKLKNEDIGDRTKYGQFCSAVITNDDNRNGWHFSYLYGKNVNEYVKKIRAFSHQEFATPYFLNTNRIETCIEAGIDLFERYQILVKDDSVLEVFASRIRNMDVGKYVYKSSLISMKPVHLAWLFRIKVINRIRNAFRNRFLKHD